MSGLPVGQQQVATEESTIMARQWNSVAASANSVASAVEAMRGFVTHYITRFEELSRDNEIKAKRIKELEKEVETLVKKSSPAAVVAKPK